MALIDPCVALPFDNKTAHLADEREAQTDDQPLTPTTPTTPTETPLSPFSARSVQSYMTAGAAPATSSPHSSAASQSQSQSPAHLTTLPTVLQSVFSYIFTDHQSQQQLHSGNSPQAAPTSPLASASTTHSPLSPPPSPSAHVVSSPVTPLSSSSFLPSPASAAPPTKSGRHCAILDLDETLLHSFFPDKVTQYQYQYMVMKCKAQETDERDGRMHPTARTLYQVDVGDGTIVVLMLRPHLRPFLDSLFSNYDVGVWSAGGKLYVDAICRVLFPTDSHLRPLFQLCWDDVQVETNGLSSYTKPLTTLISRFTQLSLPTLFLVDNRKENGLHFPSQLVIAPDYLPRPWEWNGDRDRDSYLLLDAMNGIADCVAFMKRREMSRLVGRDRSDAQDMSEGEEEEEEELESEMGVGEEEEGAEADEEEHDAETEEEDEEEVDSGADEHEHFTSDDEADYRANQLDSSMYDADGADEQMDDEAIANSPAGRRQSQKTAA